ncbi:MAG: hypothetical protein JWO11_3405, partial [Nocardioides sp.]|nr:hypothetical protein [Nocardioides sp.]
MITLWSVADTDFFDLSAFAGVYPYRRDRVLPGDAQYRPKQAENGTKVCLRDRVRVRVRGDLPPVVRTQVHDRRGAGRLDRRLWVP